MRPLKINQITFSSSQSANTADQKQIHQKVEDLFRDKPDLVFIFGGVNKFSSSNGVLQHVIKKKGLAKLIGCSGLGEMSCEAVTENKMVATALTFDKKIEFKTTFSYAKDSLDSYGVGKRIAKDLLADDLTAVFILSPGVDMNGSQLLKGVREVLGNQVTVTGGMAGDGAHFIKTWTLLDDQVSDRNVVAVGFYGTSLKVGFGSAGGWKRFGPARTATQSVGNVLYAIDGEPALDVYKKFLGEKAQDLPNSGLLYPFEVMGRDQAPSGLIRTILGVNEKAGSLILAGDVEEGSFLHLMHSNNESLVAGAQESARQAFTNQDSNINSFGILISCVGRKIVMGESVQDEVEAVKSIFGKSTTVTGFYSHGEICPLEGFQCQLHNQTMTITHFTET